MDVLFICYHHYGWLYVIYGYSAIIRNIKNELTFLITG